MAASELGEKVEAPFQEYIGSEATDLIVRKLWSLPHFGLRPIRSERVEAGDEIPDGDIDVDMMVRDKDDTKVTCQPCVYHEAAIAHSVYPLDVKTNPPPYCIVTLDTCIMD